MSQDKYTFADLVSIMKKLRAPDGCPWDREQTHQSIKKHLVEEAYEMVEVIDENNPQKMADESGDLLLQVVFHSVIAEDNKEYTIDDVTDAICRKMMHRHPHLFEGGVPADWDEIKRRDRGQTTITKELSDVSSYLPSLMRAKKILAKSQKHGFAPSMMPPTDNPELTMGAELFAIIEKYQSAGIDPELALRRYLNHWIDAFHDYEITKENSEDALG